MIYSIKILVACIRQQFITSFGRSMFRFCIFVQPIVYGFILGMMYIERTSEEFLVYAIFGSGIISFWSSICYSSASDIERERSMGTLESIFIAPAGFKKILLGKIIGNTIWGVISMGISAMFVILVFNKNVHIANLPLVSIGFILMIISFIAIAMLVSTLLTLSRNTRLVMNFMEFPIYLLCGIAFPIQNLPTIVRPLSYLLSPTWSVIILRKASSGQFGDEIILYFLGLISVTLMYCVTANFLIKIITFKVKVEATLGVY